jgi:hypothetical protein
MLSLKLGLSLNSSNYPSGSAWSPSDETSLEGWWKKDTLVSTVDGKVSVWGDSSGNNIEMRQDTAGNRPSFSSGVLTFDNAATNYLQTSGQISLSGDFTIGAKIKPDTGLGVVVADLTATGEFVRFNTSNNLRVKVDNGANTDIPKDSGDFLEEAYMVLTRSSGTLTLYWKGVAQSTTRSLSGTADVDGIGARKPSNNPFDGEMSEIQIYSSSSAELTANVNAWLLNLMP